MSAKTESETTMTSPNKYYAVRVSHLSDADNQRLKAFLQELVKDAPSYAKAKLLVHVSGYGNVASYVRAAPGAKRLVDTLGKDSFDLFGGLLAVGFQAYDDAQRRDLNGAQKIGRLGFALMTAAPLFEAPPLAIAMFVVAVACPAQYDKVTAAFFTDQNPLVRGLADMIVRYGGKPFERWATQPSLIDFF